MNRSPFEKSSLRREYPMTPNLDVVLDGVDASLVAVDANDLGAELGQCPRHASAELSESDDRECPHGASWYRRNELDSVNAARGTPTSSVKQAVV